jgi:hypothetical protein
VDFEEGVPIYDNINVRVDPHASSPSPSRPQTLSPEPSTAQSKAKSKEQEERQQDTGEEHGNHEQSTHSTDAKTSDAQHAPPKKVTRHQADIQTYKAPKAILQKWHSWLSHLSNTQIRKLHKAGLIHVTSFKNEHIACEICCQSKATKHPSRQRMPETSRPFERLHFDIVGSKDSLPFNIELYKYILIVTDDYTRHRWAFPLNRKSQAVLKLQWLNQSMEITVPRCTNRSCLPPLGRRERIGKKGHSWNS